MRSQFVNVLRADKLVVVGCANVGLVFGGSVGYFAKHNVKEQMLSPRNKDYNLITYQCANGFRLG